MQLPENQRRVRIDGSAMKVMSFNIWSDAPRNVSWVSRRNRVADVLRRNGPDLAGLQEATQPR